MIQFCKRTISEELHLSNMAEDITAKEHANDRITSVEAKSEYLTVLCTVSWLVVDINISNVDKNFGTRVVLDLLSGVIREAISITPTDKSYFWIICANESISIQL